MTELEARQKIVDIISSWIGCKQGDSVHKSIVDTYNNHKPLAQNYKVKYTDAWCATTVSAAAIKAGYTDIIPTECSCARMIDLLKKNNIWVEEDSYVPKVGDIVFYDWGDSGTGDNTGHPDHVGICEKVDGNDIYVIEGNKSKACGRRIIKVNGKFVRGFGIPKYALKANSKDVVKPKLPKKVKINVSNTLNIRKGPSTNDSVLGFLKTGSVITIDKIEGNFAHFSGWISGKEKYVKK